jgi:hypothetical protein
LVFPYCHNGSREPTLGNLKLLVTAHATAIAYESIDVLLGKPPSLDPKLLQSKMIFGGRGGYYFEQNMLLRAGTFAWIQGDKPAGSRSARTGGRRTPTHAAHGFAG